MGLTELAKEEVMVFKGLYRTSMSQQYFVLPDCLFMPVLMHHIPDFLHISHYFLFVIDQYGPMEFSLLLYLILNSPYVTFQFLLALLIQHFLGRINIGQPTTCTR